MKFLTPVIFCLLFTSCLFESSPPTDPNYFALVINIDGAEEDISDGENNLTIFSGKFFIDGVTLYMNNAEDIIYEQPELVGSFSRFSIGNDQTLAVSEIEAGQYTGIEFLFETPDKNNEISDTDLIKKEGGNIIEANSFIVTGIYNGESFTYKTSLEAEQAFIFDDSVVLPEYNSSITIRLVADVKDWFMDSGSEMLIDPNSNQQKIFNNILNSFSIEIIDVIGPN